MIKTTTVTEKREEKESQGNSASLPRGGNA